MSMCYDLHYPHSVRLYFHAYRCFCLRSKIKNFLSPQQLSLVQKPCSPILRSIEMKKLKFLVFLLINLIVLGECIQDSADKAIIADSKDSSRDANTSMTLGELWVYFTTWSGITTGFLAFWAVIYVKVFIIWVLWSWFFFGLFNGRNGGPYGSGYGKPQYSTYSSRNSKLEDMDGYFSRILEVLSPGTVKFN